MGTWKILRQFYRGPVDERLNGYFSTSAFTQPAPYTIGNVSRALPDVRGDGMGNWDFSLFKNYRVT